MEVLYTDEFGEWFGDLLERDQDDVVYVVELLKSQGVTLGAPHSSALNGTKYALRELRPRRGASAVRVVYAFDPNRNAIIIIGGLKNEARLYERMLKKAEEIWERHLEEVAKK